jgi:putative folate metabolism gamma-glutamate ligase
MHAEALKTPRVEPGDNLERILDSCVPPLGERSIVAITSKIVSLSQNRIVKKSAAVRKEDLILREADAVADVPDHPYGLYITIKDNILTPSAGIDESNGDGIYILYPDNVQAAAAAAWSFLRKKHSVENLGVIITDSRLTPLRLGVTGMALGWCGFMPLHNYIGTPDLYGTPMKVTLINLPDALAATAALMMGEGNECTPLCVIKDPPKLVYQSRPPTDDEVKSISIPLAEDLYAPLLTQTKWITADPGKARKSS